MSTTLRALALVGLVLVGCRAKKPESKSTAAQRQAPGPLVTTPAVAAASPLAGPVGRDADGRPTQYVDRAVLRGMLARREFAALTAFFEDLQTQFEEDATKERWTFDAPRAFESAEPELEASLDAWTAATPDSFAPHVASAIYLNARGHAQRGGSVVWKTPPADLAAMHATFERAVPRARRSLELRPKALTARHVLLQIARAEGRGEDADREISAALASCPTCFDIRVSYLWSSTPRWGGDYATLERFVKSHPAASPMMKYLPGFIDLAKAQDLESAKRFPDALASVEKACALGDYWEFFFHRGRLERLHGDPAKARTDLDRALALRPASPHVLAERAELSAQERRWEAAARDLRGVMQIEPTNPVKRLVPTLVQGLQFEADQHRRANRTADAVRLLDLAAELAPNDPDVIRRRAWTILGDAGAPDAIAGLEEAAKQSPDDFAVHQRLAYALGRQRRFDREAEMWTAYLARHPDDAKAYFERGGAFFHLGKRAESKADATKACELGLSEACARVKQLP